MIRITSSFFNLHEILRIKMRYMQCRAECLKFYHKFILQFISIWRIKHDFF